MASDEPPGSPLDTTGGLRSPTFGGNAKRLPSRQGLTPADGGHKARRSFPLSWESA